MAITTLKGHVSRAYDFYNKPNKYFGIGKTTPWDNEMTPPTPTINDDRVEVVGYKLIESLFMVIPDDNGELVYRDTKWKIVPADQAYEKGARWVYVSTHVSYTELTTNADKYGYDDTKKITLIYGTSAKNAKQEQRVAYLQEVLNTLYETLPQTKN